ncbi:hypothetical protein E7Z59_03530 [Robertkochia marina]|uniref:Uncharacterized protein n=1 Tax=Robertkochia marina TaxID=1227945 RepID=A0A4S3M3D9_9FLAO|nr:thrombospondin type 3 repeat-containing protein [Robertkochia marina]THD69410.1 hypothetical protein E7Z59_03530 [Robertkochia marina]TRZ47329.1 hypothetical protein D3A96_01045 [Robertkochia marina]
MKLKLFPAFKTIVFALFTVMSITLSCGKDDVIPDNENPEQTETPIPPDDDKGSGDDASGGGDSGGSDGGNGGDGSSGSGGGDGSAGNDDDKDGIANDLDQCPESPEGASVNEQGCAESQLDDDNDGISNDLDQCPETPEGSSVNGQGCAESQLDDDNDGISNDLDQCPETPEGANVNEQGCAESQLDDDNDGVSNDLDQCPETPEGIDVNAQGCAASQLDDDNDGISDDVDQCPETPEGANVNAEGCAASQLDDDNDGISNDSDQCPNTPEGASVNSQGCLLNPDCNDPSSYIFQESDGLVLVEFEAAVFPEGWVLKNDLPGISGSGYMVWENRQYFNQPGNGSTSYRINISAPGTYRFIWKSAVTIGDKGSEHNDTWLRFADAADFYGEKDGLRVYPLGTGKEPNPEGASGDGWLKVYRGGGDLGFKWQAKTSDNDPHDVFVVFDAPGVYTMEVSARSTGHGIDKFALFNNSVSISKVRNEVFDFSEINCN